MPCSWQAARAASQPVAVSWSVNASRSTWRCAARATSAAGASTPSEQLLWVCRSIRWFIAVSLSSQAAEQRHPVPGAIAVDDERRVGDGIAHVVAQRLSGLIDHTAAGLEHHGLTGRGIPLGGRTATHVQVAAALGQQAEFQRAAEAETLLRTQCLELAVQLRVAK